MCFLPTGSSRLHQETSYWNVNGWASETFTRNRNAHKNKLITDGNIKETITMTAQGAAPEEYADAIKAHCRRQPIPH